MSTGFTYGFSFVTPSVGNIFDCDNLHTNNIKELLEKYNKIIINITTTENINPITLDV